MAIDTFDVEHLNEIHEWLRNHPNTTGWYEDTTRVKIPTIIVTDPDLIVELKLTWL